MKNIALSSILLFAILTACSEEPVGQQPVDRIAPGPVSNVTVENTPGGAKLNYTLPGDEDLLYVKAVYSRKAGEISENRTSLYKDTLRVEGFGDMQPHEVKVIAVDRSRNESTPVTANIQPLEPEIMKIGRSLDLVADFGGVLASWENSNRAEISVTILQENDSIMEYVPIETFYSSVTAGSGAARGMDTVPGKFGLYVQDHWENRSEVKYYELTPLYETLFDRMKFRDARISGDASEVGGWPLARMWDGTKGNDSGYSSPGGTGTWPHTVTIDLGVLGQISRIRIYQRMGTYTFGEGNPRIFEVWGCQDLDPSGNWDSWTKLMDCESQKPSGLPMGENSNEDVDVAQNGEDFINSPNNPKVRYIRLRVLRTWAGGDNFQINEIEVYGDNR
ncbi:MAG: DUF4959 domain-containing protein [Tannerella sp.]|jgi:hypothetical protein|nr:DUF4959 domain-containing protein [Tannerella sp.]